MQSKILEKRQSNNGELQVTFASISNVFRKFTHTTKNHRLDQNRIQKKFQSDQSLEQKKDEVREKERLRKQLKRSMMSPEEKKNGELRLGYTREKDG